MKKPNPKDVYLELRGRVFSGSRAAFGIAGDPSRPWGAVMEMGMGKAWVTVVALADGNASIYLSSGGGFMGGHSHQSIRQAAQNMVATADRFQLQRAMHATREYTLPKNGQVTFYVLWDDGVFTSDAKEAELMGGKHALTALFAAGQEIITQYRRIEEKKK